MGDDRSGRVEVIERELSESELDFVQADFDRMQTGHGIPVALRDRYKFIACEIWSSWEWLYRDRDGASLAGSALFADDQVSRLRPHPHHDQHDRERGFDLAVS